MTPADQLRAAKVLQDAGDCRAMWRNGITNTIALIDQVRNRHSRAMKRGKHFAAFDAELDELLQQWFDASRRAMPDHYDEAEQVWKDFSAIALASSTPSTGGDVPATQQEYPNGK